MPEGRRRLVPSPAHDITLPVREPFAVDVRLSFGWLRR
jgi:hypothetical protein